MNVRLSLVLSILLIMFAAGSSLSQAPRITTRNDSNRDLEMVNRLCNLGEFDKALAYLERIKATDPENPKIVYLYKMVYLEAKRYEELENLINEQLAMSPDDKLLLAELGNVRYLRDDIKGADSLWNLALNGAGSNATVYLYVAGYKLQYGDYDGAADAYLKGRDAIGSPALFSAELAGVYESQRKYREAVLELLLNLSQSPMKFNMVSSKIGGFFKDADDDNVILDAIIEGASKYPNKKEFQELLGEAYIKLKRMDKAFETFGKLGKGQNDDGASFCMFAEHCLDNQAYPTAIEAVDEYLRITKFGVHKEQALLIKGEAEQKLGKIDSAIMTLRELKGISKNHMMKEDASFRLGKIFAYDKGDCDAAIEEWKDLAKPSPLISEIEAEATVEQASCYMKLDRMDEAKKLLTDLTSAQSQYSATVKAQFLLGDLAFINGDYGEAKKLYENLAMYNPSDPYANNALERLAVLSASNFDGEAGDGLERFAGCLRLLDQGKLIEAAGEFADSSFYATALYETANYYSASTYLLAGDTDTAIRRFQQYIDSFPEGAFVDRSYFSLGEIYMQDSKTYPLAIKAFNRILEDYSDGPLVEQARERLRRLEDSSKIG